jgi:hypothetical protein
MEKSSTQNIAERFLKTDQLERLEQTSFVMLYSPLELVFILAQ